MRQQVQAFDEKFYRLNFTSLGKELAVMAEIERGQAWAPRLREMVTVQGGGTDKLLARAGAAMGDLWRMCVT